MTEESKPPPPKKKKEPLIIPPEINTAQLLLQGVSAGVLGASLLDLKSRNQKIKFQSTFLKEKPRKTGKFALSYGKRFGDFAAIELKDADAIFSEVSKAIQSIIDQKAPIFQFELGINEARELYGKDVVDKMVTNATAEKVFVVWIPDLFFDITDKQVGLLENTGKIEKVELEFNKNIASALTSGAKSKKCELSFKFEVFGEFSDSGQFGLSQKSSDLPKGGDLCNLFENQVRLGALKNEEIEEEGPKPTTENEEKSDEMVVNAFEVKGIIDYDKLVDKFGSKLIEEDLLQRFAALVEKRGGKDAEGLHRFLRRGIFFSHRDLDVIVGLLEKGKKVFLYTGRGPSSSAMHLGHLIPFQFTAYLQRALDLPCVIQMTDDEKFLFKGVYKPPTSGTSTGDNLSYFQNLTVENARDIIACGFVKEKTFLFSDMEYVGRMYPNIVKIWRSVTTSTVTGIFGFTGSDNIGKVAFPAIQAAPSFASSFPTVLGTVQNEENLFAGCLIPCAIDQDPYFRMTRDVAHRLVPKDHPTGGKPSLIHSKFFPPLQGSQGKMSSSDTNSAIFLTDTKEEIREKITTQAFSGGQETSKLQRELGANLETDVSYQWLTFFLEDDELLKSIGDDYSTGSGEFWATGKVKAKLISELNVLVEGHQARRALVTDDVVKEFMCERNIID
uniref:tryptophan--tRNA ligase n=1 Tax=Leptocylindrus danicus TaxID=163516 RepID=A0A7S2P106_9STRA|mmetsp:Transcript_1986/g.2922  ORF Transcript_1986/g.2922 Transcript_1986/m.2922 type:complete len:671 (+) Transcript_1986:52-2064(+)